MCKPISLLEQAGRVCAEIPFLHFLLLLKVQKQDELIGKSAQPNILIKNNLASLDDTLARNYDLV